MSNTEILLNQSLWIPAGSELAIRAKHELQYTVPGATRQSRNRIVRLYQEIDGYVVVPRHYLDHTVHSVRWVGPDSYPLLHETCDIEPYGNTPAERQVQADAFDFLESYKDNPAGMDAIVSLRCGGGKTCIGIRAAFKYGYHFLIAAHTEDILLNWEKELRERTTVKSVGRIISGKFDLQPVTLALIPSLIALKEDKVEQIRDAFGTILIDEMHHLAAEKFSIVSNMFSGRRIGLSATLAREDGMSYVYYLALGKDVFYRDIKRKKAEVYFKRIDVGNDALPVNYAEATSSLALNERYLDSIAADIREGYRGMHKQIIIASRKSILYALQEKLRDLDPGVNTSETPPEVRQHNLITKRVVFIIDIYGKEGLNEPSLTQARIVTPIKDPNAIVQMVGRLERGDTVMQAFFYSAQYVPFLRTLHKAKEALVRNQYIVKEVM